MNFYPVPARLPIDLQLEGMILRPLRASDNTLDYAAVMTSGAYLRIGMSGEWPREGFTPDENLLDLQLHETEHDERTSFTFTIMNHAQDECRGCIYIQPMDRLLEKYAPLSPNSFPRNCAYISFWMRPSCQEERLDLYLLRLLMRWFADEWDFPRVVFTANQLEIHQRGLYEQAGLKPLLTLDSPNRLTLYG